MTTAIRYPLRRIRLAVIVWCNESDNRVELAQMERFVHQLAESLGVQQLPLFITVDRMTRWAWIPLSAAVASNTVSRIRALAQAANDGPYVAVGNPFPGVEGFRRSHQQAQDAYTVATASGATARRVTAASDPELSMAGLLGGHLGAARVGSVKCSARSPSPRIATDGFAKPCERSCARAQATKRPPRSSTFTSTREISRAARARTPGPTDRRRSTRRRSGATPLRPVRRSRAQLSRRPRYATANTLPKSRVRRAL